MYIRRYTSPDEIVEYGYPHSNALLQFCLKFESCKPYNAARHQTLCDVINRVKPCPTVYPAIFSQDRSSKYPLLLEYSSSNGTLFLAITLNLKWESHI